MRSLLSFLTASMFFLACAPPLSSVAPMRLELEMRASLADYWVAELKLFSEDEVCPEVGELVFIDDFDLGQRMFGGWRLGVVNYVTPQRVCDRPWWTSQPGYREGALVEEPPTLRSGEDLVVRFDASDLEVRFKVPDIVAPKVVTPMPVSGGVPVVVDLGTFHDRPSIHYYGPTPSSWDRPLPDSRLSADEKHVELLLPDDAVGGYHVIFNQYVRQEVPDCAGFTSCLLTLNVHHVLEVEVSP